MFLWGSPSEVGRSSLFFFALAFQPGCRTFSPERNRRACGFQGAGFASPRGAPRPAITQKKRAAPKSGSFAFLSQLTERSSKFSFPSSPAACAAQTLAPGGKQWTNWTPSGQDDAGAVLLNRANAVNDAMQGGWVSPANFQNAMWDSNTTWTSLPDGSQQKPGYDMIAAYQVFQNAMTYLPECQ